MALKVSGILNVSSSGAAPENAEEHLLNPAVGRVVERRPPVPGAELGVCSVPNHQLNQVQVSAHTEPLERSLPDRVVHVDVDHVTVGAEKILELLVVRLLHQVLELLLYDRIVLTYVGRFR